MTDRSFFSDTARWLAAMSTRDGSVDSVVRRLPTPLIAVLGPAAGGVFLIPHPWIGALLWLAIFLDLRYAAFALLGVAISEGIARLFHIRDTSPIDGNLKANALLAALAAAWLTGLGEVSLETQITVVVVSALAATILTAAITGALAGANLPSLVLGYCLVATMLFAIFPRWTEAAVYSTEWWPVPVDLLEWVITFFRTLGALLFSPTLEAGIVIAAAVFLWSRTAFAAGVVGWIAGVVGAITIGQEDVVYYWMPTAYNFFLAGMALGATFFLPGPTSLMMAAIGGYAAAILAVGLQSLFPDTALGYLPFASILTVWIAVYALALGDEQAIARRNRATELPPEEAWWRETYWLRRAGEAGLFLVVPIGGRALVAQGIDGGLSHTGPWRNALDFQCPGTPDPAAARAGEATWNAPVIAPAAGIVERVRNDVPDNPLGTCNYAEKWGNYVILRLDQGGWVLLAHLRQGSVAVTPGMRVEIGARLGAVGNSGRSPAPHLHLQAQHSPELGAPSAPFGLANFLSANDAAKPLLRWHSVALPEQGTIVASALPNPGVHAVLASAAPGLARWSVETSGVIPSSFWKARSEVATRISISLDAAGRHLFRGQGGGALVSSLDEDAWRVLDLELGDASILTLLALAAPSIPYAAVAGMTWEEPAPITPVGLVPWLGLALSPYLAEPFAHVGCRCVSAPSGRDEPLVVETDIESFWPWLPRKLTCEFDRLRGPVRLEACFRRGTLKYALLSFEPGLPFNGQPA